jgi:hypothetical protein
VGFMLPLSRARAEAYWRAVCASAALGERVLLVAEDAQGAITGTVQVLLNQPENQPWTLIRPQRCATYMVISMPKRSSVAFGVSHFISMSFHAGSD